VKNRKIVGLTKLRRVVRSLRRRRKKVVFTNGCFDLVHAGHVRYLRKARALGDALVVGVNTDHSVRRLKGPGRPLVSLRHRMEVLSALESVDFVQAFDSATPEPLIRQLLPSVLVKGADYARRDIAGRNAVEESGGEVVRIPMVAGLSTSRLLAKVRRGRW
jgi:rfaE bifunctional protein nucleotidyltransferase chain/domain